MSEIKVKIVAPEEILVSFPGNIDGKKMNALFTGPLAEERGKDYAAALELAFTHLEGVSLESAVEFAVTHAHTDEQAQDAREISQTLDRETVELG